MKKIIYISSYILSIVYLIFCLLNIEGWVKSHTEYIIFVLIPLALAVIMSVVFLILKLTKKIAAHVFLLPLLLMIISVSIDAVGTNIPCCVGG